MSYNYSTDGAKGVRLAVKGLNFDLITTTKFPTTKFPVP